MYAVGLDNIYLFTLLPSILAPYSTLSPVVTNELNEVLFGCMLGDGQLTMEKRSTNARFSFIQSTINSDYFHSLAKLFAAFCNAP